IIFSVVGIFFDQYGEIPVNIYRFLGNFFLLEYTYNGAWWFASTYTVFILISPLFLKLAKKVDSRVLFIVFAMIFCVYYLYKVMMPLNTSPEEYYWKGFWFRKLSDLWYVSFFYIVGMLLAKEKMISRMRKWWEQIAGRKSNFYLFIVVAVTTLMVCVIEVSGIVYFIAIFYFICFHLWKKPDYVEKFFLFFGEHSTNIWLIHMFFYLFIFKDLVFIVKYPVFVIPFMFSLSIACSYVINFVLKQLWKIPLLRKLTACVENSGN
ncbi:MAG: acyltransferase family protein, partial [Lachnospiraceae bacterium]|nr:acyltransferase family protein [Lachnospiraceae bacterium]